MRSQELALLRRVEQWLRQYHNEIDEILFRSNRHSCREKRTSVKYKKDADGKKHAVKVEEPSKDRVEFDNRDCKDPKTGACEA